MALLSLYDGNCSLCKAAKEKSQKLDWLHRVEWMSLQEYEKKGRRPSFRASDLRRELHLVGEGGEVYIGFYAARKMLLQFPLMVLPALLLYLPFASVIGVPVYRWIARNRYKWLNAECKDGSCSL